MCALTKREAVASGADLGFTNPFQSNFGKPLQQVALNPGLSYEDVQKDDFQFDMDAHDVMVFLHIQKTGGTSFGRHLVQDLDLKVCVIMANVFFYKIDGVFLETSIKHNKTLIFYLNCSVRVSVNENESDVIASEPIVMRIGCFHDIRLVGSVAFMLIGQS